MWKTGRRIAAGKEVGRSLARGVRGSDEGIPIFGIILVILMIIRCLTFTPNK